MRKNIMAVWCISFVLSGCMGSKDKFDCSFADGARCQSLGEIDRRIDAGKQIGKKEEKPVFKKLIPTKAVNPVLSNDEGGLHVLIAPYESRKGIYHGEKRMYLALEPSSRASVTGEEEGSEVIIPGGLEK